MSRLDDLKKNLRPRLERLYGEQAEQCLERVAALVERIAPSIPAADPPIWDERDVVLITYGDQVQNPGEPSLRTLHRFLTQRRLDEVINTVHLLPFFPYSSDDGFSVIDYMQVDANLGDWSDIHAMGTRFRIMADLVLNHVSSRSEWFQGYLKSEDPYRDFFIEVDSQTDLSAVVRPRSLPLLTRYETAAGPRYVWTTFSEDQIDLNFANPDVLLTMLEVLLFYVAQGVRILRLDAIAFLWKEIGTSCLHLPQTHEVVKLFRDVLDAVAPHRVLLTETNVPHDENVSYFGDGDEAHMVYQFSLAPLLLDALLTGDAGPLKQWAVTVCESAPSTTYLNFTASHDGVGVRPLQGLVDEDRFERLLGEVRSRGGHVSTRRLADGTDSPYELNIAYLSALEDREAASLEDRARRFLTSQAVMLALRGVPAVYFHSLVGTPNDHDNVARTGRARSINRKKYDEAELNAVLSNPGSLQRLIFEKMKHMLAVRIHQPAFHPEASQRILNVVDAAVLAFERTSLDASQQILVLVNVSGDLRTVGLEDIAGGSWIDLLTSLPREIVHSTIQLKPWEIVWLTPQSE